jgi:Ca-activated chloride channel family protein
MTNGIRRRWFPILAAIAGSLLGLLIFAPHSGLLVRAQEPQGPQPNVGETVLKPKKAEPNQPAPTPAPEKKPERINPADIYTLSTTTNLVNVDVLVTTENGQPIPGLQKNNFKVYDDGTEQSITNFGISKTPMTVTLLIEFSRLFWGFDYLALRDSYEFLNFMQPQDWVATIYYDMQQHILTDFTHDRSEVRSGLDTLRIPEFSENNLYDSLAFTLDRMKNIQGRKAILLISTGCDSFSKLNYDQILKIVKDSDTMVYPVSTLEFMTVRYGEAFPCTPGMQGYGASMNSLQARNALNTIAKYSGGQAYFPRFEQDIPDIYRQIAGQLRTEYSLGFVPTNPAKDGKYHKLKVDLVGSGGEALKIVNQKGKKVKYRVVSRDGYYAPKS